MRKKELIGLSCTGMLGSRFSLESFNDGLKRNPDFIGQDAGSTDIGPYYLGSSTLFSPRSSYKRDIQLLLGAAREGKIPLIIGSALTNGTNQQLKVAEQIVREIAAERNLTFRMAIIESEVDKEYLKQRASTEEIEALKPLDRNLTVKDIDGSTSIVAQMGVEPIIKALDAGAEVVIAGRACDDVIFAAFPIKEGFDPGLALHMGKVLECASMSAVPCDLGSAMLGFIREDHFLLEPADPKRICTVTSVAAHALYERSDPCLQPGPGGMNDLSQSTYVQHDRRTVKVTGSRFIKDDVYKVKLEGASFLGHRAVCMVGVRDPVLVERIDDAIGSMNEEVRSAFPECEEGKGYRLFFHIYGKNGVMGELEPQKKIASHELGILIEIVAETPELAKSICMFTRGHMQHMHYEGIVATAGNLAYPFSPFMLDGGEAYRFSVYHLLPLKDPCECFPMRIVEVK
jgi:hypothetical protein